MSGDPTVAAYRIDGRTVPAGAFYAAACDPSRSIAVEACAGAGKTWMLVARIMRALLDGAAPQDILAITFTRKAAGEMRVRLQQELGRCAALDDAGRAATLRAWGLSGAEAQRRAPELASLQQLLAAQGRGVQLRTFHGWFSTLLRGAPLSLLEELKLPLTHELLEDDKKPLPLLWPRFYAAVAASDEDRQAFFDSVARYGRHQTLKALETALSKRVEFALADAEGAVDGSVQQFGERFPEMAGLDEPEDAASTPAMQESLWAAAKVLGAAKAPSFSVKGAELERALTDGVWSGICDALLTKDGEPRKFGSKIAEIDVVRQAQELLQSVRQAREQHEAWQHQRRMGRLTRVLLACYADLKRERGWVDMNDLEAAASRLLGDPALSGWLQQRLDARVRHLLIDEFQDTNPLQWQALYGWLSAYAGSGSGEAPGVFLVGDPKQSIYRFRRAEPQVFKAAQAFVVEGLGGSLLSCDHTRRCAPAVVEVINAAMAEAQERDEYGGFRAHTTESTTKGTVLALPPVQRPEKDGKTADAVPVWRDSLTVPRVPAEEEGIAAREAAQVADWLVAQLAMPSMAVPDQPSVMVLARKRSRLRVLHEALRERGIASEAPGETDLGESPAVQDLTALLDALVSPRHHLSLARALRSPLFGWSDADLAALALAVRSATPPVDKTNDGVAKPLPPAWWDVLQAAPPEGVEAVLAARWRETATALATWQGWVRSLPPHDALSAIYEANDVLARYAAAVPASEAATTLAALRDLLALSLSQDGGRFLTPYRFVRALKAGGIPASDSHQPGAVRLLTIHGAKGLEAHTVILLDTDSPPQRPESMGVLVDWPAPQPRPQRFVFLASEKSPPACAEELLQAERQARAVEELNALYVALTRAETRLLLSSFVPYQDPGLSWWRRLQPLAATEAAAPVTEAGTSRQTHGTTVLRRLPSLTAVAAPADTAEPETPDERTRLGLAMHRLLQWHPTPASGFQWTEAHRQAVTREFDLSPALGDEAVSMARRMVGGEAAWAWDADALQHWDNEVEVWQGGELLRLDRLVRRRDTGHWWVLDFKSAARPEQQSALREQMGRYRRALNAAHPNDTVRLAFINAAGRLIELNHHES